MLASYTSTTDGDGKALRIVSYSVTARYSVWLSGEQEETQSGDYDAVLAMRDGKPELLQITDV